MLKKRLRRHFGVNLKKLASLSYGRVAVRITLLILSLTLVFPKYFSNLFPKPTFVWPWTLVGEKYKFSPDEIVTIPVKHFNESFLLDRTMSASLYTLNMKLVLIVLIVGIILVFLAFIRPRLRSKVEFTNSQTLFLFFTLAITTYHSLSATGDLPDEAYVWASKIKNLSSHGVLGVLMWDDSYQESSVSTLPFLITYFVHLGKFLTIEQSLVLTSLLQQIFFIIAVFVFLILLKLPNIYVYPQILIFGLSSAITKNVISGFDSLAAGLVLIFWIYFEVNTKNGTNEKSKLLIATLAPLVRLDLAIISLVIFGSHFVEVFKTQKLSKLKFLSKCKLYIIPFTIFFCWVLYKIVYFGSIVPAMVKYKSPVFDQRYILLGLSYVRDSLSLQTCILLVALSLYLIFKPSFTFVNPELQSLNKKLLIVTFISFISVSFTGGDYFGASMARYIIPYVVAWLIFFLVCYSRLDKVKEADRKKFRRSNYSQQILMPARFLLLLIIGLNLVFVSNSFSKSNFFPDIVPRRTTCDSLAASAFKSFLSNDKEGLVVATSEVNGIAYSLDAKLFDLSGLVESRNYPLKLTPPDGGFLFYKFRTPILSADISKVDVIWFWGSANCDDFSSNDDVRAALKQNRDAAAVDLLVNSWVSEFRVGSLRQLQEWDFIPVISKFSYVWKNQTRMGSAVFLVNKRILKNRLS